MKPDIAQKAQITNLCRQHDHSSFYTRQQATLEKTLLESHREAVRTLRACSCHFWVSIRTGDIKPAETSVSATYRDNINLAPLLRYTLNSSSGVFPLIFNWFLSLRGFEN